MKIEVRIDWGAGSDPNSEERLEVPPPIVASILALGLGFRLCAGTVQNEDNTVWTYKFDNAPKQGK